MSELALRFLASFDRPDPGSEVPFYLASSLGGSRDLRGFAINRFRDRGRMLLTVEHRVRVARSLHLALFADAGKVFQHRREFDLHSLEHDFGIGIRLHNRGGIVGRLDLARSREGFALYASLADITF